MKGKVGVAVTLSAMMMALATPVSAACVGDCDDSGDVIVSELITGINIALGSAELSACTSFDEYADLEVTVNELITSINNALSGCVVDGVCGDGSVGPGEECDDGNSWGGDGCAANCTNEQRLECVLSDDARATLQTNLFALPLPVSGQQYFTIGKANDGNGEIPVVMKVEDMQYAPVSLVGLVCACVRGGAMESFGPGNAGNGTIGCGAAGLAETDYLSSVDHNTNDVDPSCENGTLEDGSPTHPHTGVCNGKPVVTFTGGGPRGSMYLEAAIAISLVQDGGACTENCAIPDNGPDCLPCTADDTGQTEATYVPLTTGTADGEVLDANNTPDLKISADSLCGASACQTSATGSPATCDALDSDPAAFLPGSGLAGAIANLDIEQIGDGAITVLFGCK